MKQSERIKKGCMLSPKKRLVRARITQGEDEPILIGDFEYPRSSKLQEGKMISIRGLSHSLRVLTHTVEGKREFVTLQGTADAFERLGRKERWRTV